MPGDGVQRPTADRHTRDKSTPDTGIAVPKVYGNGDRRVDVSRLDELSLTIGRGDVRAKGSPIAPRHIIRNLSCSSGRSFYAPRPTSARAVVVRMGSYATIGPVTL